MSEDISKVSEDDFQSAFVTEMGGTPESSTAPEPPVEEPAAEPPAQVPPADDAEPVEGEPAEPEEEPSETPEEKAERESKEAADAAAAPTDEPEGPKYATKDDVKEALKEYNESTAGRYDAILNARQEIISKLHPEGIDRTIYDTNGEAIRTAQDVVDRGLVKNNGEPYTYEEAASFILEANRKMDENIEKLETWAGEMAEKNISFVESNQRVMDKWGETLATLPKEKVEEIAQKYMDKQLKFDDGDNFIIDMAMTPEEYYDLVLEPYAELNKSRQEQAEREAAEAKAAEEAAKQAKKDEQDERAGLPPQRGTSRVKSNTGDEFLDALIDEMEKE